MAWFSFKIHLSLRAGNAGGWIPVMQETRWPQETRSREEGKAKQGIYKVTWVVCESSTMSSRSVDLGDRMSLSAFTGITESPMCSWESWLLMLCLSFWFSLDFSQAETEFQPDFMLWRRKGDYDLGKVGQTARGRGNNVSNGVGGREE